MKFLQDYIKWARKQMFKTNPIKTVMSELPSGTNITITTVTKPKRKYVRKNNVNNT